MCSGKSEHFLPHMWHPSRFTPNNWKPKYVETSHMSQLVNKPFNICGTKVPNLWTRSCMMTIEFPKSIMLLRSTEQCLIGIVINQPYSCLFCVTYTAGPLYLAPHLIGDFANWLKSRNIMAAKKIKYGLKNSLTKKNREIKRSRKCASHENAKLNGHDI